LLAYEVLTAFFLEASFLGIMLFGWKRVGPGLALLLHLHGRRSARLISAFWILSANSWMQTPQGWTWAEDGTMIATNFMEVIFNPSLPSRFAHMVLAAFLTTAMVVAGASAFALARRSAQSLKAASRLRMAVLMMAIVTPMQIMVGHESGIVAGHHQPAKVAALEGWWTTRTQQPTVLIGWPDEEAETNHFELAIPGFGSTVNNAGPDDVLPGLDQFAEARSPAGLDHVLGVPHHGRHGPRDADAWAFGARAAWALKRLDAAIWYHRALVLAAPSGFVAVLTGWITAEVGRQPYVVYGVLRTADAVSPVPRRLGRDVAAVLHRRVRHRLQRRRALHPAPHGQRARQRRVAAAIQSTARHAARRRDQGGGAVMFPPAPCGPEALHDLGLSFPCADRRRVSSSMSRSTASTSASAFSSRSRRTRASATRCRPPSRRCGTATRLGSCSAAAACSRRFPKAYAALSCPRSICRSSSCCSRSSFAALRSSFAITAVARQAKWWTIAFSAGSIVAAIAQGLVLGGFIQGVTIGERRVRWRRRSIG
jgi:hypothetical protein